MTVGTLLIFTNSFCRLTCLVNQCIIEENEKGVKELNRFFLFLLLIGTVLFSFGCTKNNTSEQPHVKEDEPVELLVSAAASLTDALQDIKTSFEKTYSNITITYNFGSSGKLAQMISQGAPSDVFLSASEHDMDTLQENDLIIFSTRKPFIQNELVLITNKDNELDIHSFEDIRPETIQHFSIGEPESVPVGRYTKETLEHLNLWTPLQNNFVFGSDVRQVLTHVELGNAEIGIVYASDATISSKVKVLATADTSWHHPISYPGAVVSVSNHRREAKQFLDFLATEESIETLQQYGFQELAQE